MVVMDHPPHSLLSTSKMGTQTEISWESQEGFLWDVNDLIIPVPLNQDLMIQ